MRHEAGGIRQAACGMRQKAQRATHNALRVIKLSSGKLKGDVKAQGSMQNALHTTFQSHDCVTFYVKGPGRVGAKKPVHIC